MAERWYQQSLLVFCVIVCPSIAYADNSICGTQEAFERFQCGQELLRPPNGPKYVYSPHFIVHFDTAGYYACNRAYAESTAIYAEFSWAKQVGGLGWAAPPPDNQGPDNRYDIYIQNLDPYYGETCLESPYPNPYPTGFASYILLHNTLSWDFLRFTTAHEFNHACQLRYSAQYNWWYENTATWMQDVCYDHVDWHIVCLEAPPNPLSNPNMAITTTDSFYEYSGYLWARFIQEHYSITCLRLIWERIGQVGGFSTLSAIDSILHNYDSELKTALGTYAIWRYFTGDRADTIGHFSESHLWPTSYVDASHQHTGSGSGNQGTDYISGPGGTSYIEFYTSTDYLLRNSFSGAGSGVWQNWQIGYNSTTGHSIYMMNDIDYWSILPTSFHDTIVLVPVATNASSGLTYNYAATDIALQPQPPQDPELEVHTILSPVDTVNPYSTVTPTAVIRNNGMDQTDSTWLSFYIGNYYSSNFVMGPINPGHTDTISFVNWSASERRTYKARCVVGSSFDVNRANNYRDTAVVVPLSDAEVLEILSPRGVISTNIPAQPGALIRNNRSSGISVTVTFSVADYNDTMYVYLSADSTAEISFDNWTPFQTGVCTTSCQITTSDERPLNNSIHGEVLVDSTTVISENQTCLPPQILLTVHPNPHSEWTTIGFSIDQNTESALGGMALQIYDATGRLVRDFSYAMPHAPCAMQISWEGDDNAGRKLPTGVYFVTLSVGEYSETRKTLLVK